MRKLLTILAAFAMLGGAAVESASANPKVKRVCDENGKNCRKVIVHQGSSHSSGNNQSSNNAKYKNYKALENACRAVWVDDKPDGLDTCKQGQYDSGQIDVLGSCGSSIKNGIATQESGKCNLNLQLSCRRKDQSWNDTQVSCKSLLNSADKLKNDDGNVVTN